MRIRNRAKVGYFGVVIFLIMLSNSAASQQPLSLDQALQRARVHNKNLKAARARLDQSAADVSQAWSALLPKVSAQGKYTHNYKDITIDLSPIIPTAEPIEVQKRNQLNAGLTARIPLLVPSAYPVLSAVQQAQKARNAEFKLTETSLLFSVAQAYYTAAGSDEIVVARNNALDVAKQTLQNVKVLHQGGKATSVEVMRAEVAVVRAEQAQREAEDMREQAYRALSTLIGAQEPISVAPSQVAPQEAPPETKLVEKALYLRPELAAYQRSIEAAEATGNAASWRWAPTLSAFGNVQAFNYQGFSGDNYAWAVGLQLDWVLYDGGARDAQGERASAQKREYVARLEHLNHTVKDEVANALRALETKHSALKSAVRATELSSETLRLVRIQYEGGKATQLDLLQAQDSLVAAEVAVAQARFALSLADIQLKRSSGLFPSKGKKR